MHRPRPPPGWLRAQSLVVGASASTVPLAARGNPEEDVQRAARNIRHSAAEPTGRYVQAGQSITVTLPSNVSGVSVLIGLHGTYASINGGQDVGLSSTVLSASTTTITADRAGLVYLVREFGGTTSATVSGGVAVPTFVRGKTTKKEFDRQVTQYSSAPFVTLIGNRVFADFQRSVITGSLTYVTESVIASWDAVVTKTDALYGLLDTTASVGVAQASSGRVHITNPDSTNGYSAAAGERVIFPFAFDAGKHLLRGAASDQWALWHEIGHTYQSRLYSWEGLGEVTTNISSLSIQESLGAKNRLDDTSVRTELAQWRKTPVGQRSFDSIENLWMKTLMFDQLRRAFGAGFYPRLHQEFRVQQALGEAGEADTEQMKQRFMSLASKVAQRDLSPFFEEWGISPTAETRAAMSVHPGLTRQIWNNHDRATDVVELPVAAYSVPTGALAAGSTTARRGETTPPSLTGLTSSLSSTNRLGTTRAVRATLIADEVGPRAGRVAVLLETTSGTRNVLVRPVSVTAGTAFEAIGYGDYPVATVALAPDTHTLRAWSTGTQAHPYLGDRTYLAFTLRKRNLSRRMRPA